MKFMLKNWNARSWGPLCQGFATGHAKFSRDPWGCHKMPRKKKLGFKTLESPNPMVYHMWVNTCCFPLGMYQNIYIYNLCYILHYFTLYIGE